jgi:hypothetical protein
MIIAPQLTEIRTQLVEYGYFNFSVKKIFYEFQMMAQFQTAELPLK